MKKTVKKTQHKHWELSPCGAYIGQWGPDELHGEPTPYPLVSKGGIATTKDMHVLAAAQQLLEGCRLAMGAFAVMPETPESKDAVKCIKIALESAAGKHWNR